MFGSSQEKEHRTPRYAGGPHGLGDPDDYNLRKIEENVLIPKVVRERAKYEKCAELNKAFGDCCLNTGFFAFYKCKVQVRELNECMAKWFTDETFIKECRDNYLKERKEYRLTGIRKSEQKIKS
ncbi:COX assembly mitochondrial protein homolog [Daktulosphaira vitifoliae]|uniref:COX assembly mitochondrial protein homolog n=1 Tax=Daktulosphaira vitifoliae TaxID=58002 RepID=UPI0021A99FCE|nr:COX assembly mitochondrial protein homolog [Daktulosphaira vitifoliae]